MKKSNAKTIEKSFLDPVENAHSEYGPSSAERYVNCTASVALSRRFPNTTSEASEEGTQAHTCLERLLQTKNPRAVREMLYKEFPREMVDHAWDSRDEILKLAEGGGEIRAEEKVDISHFTKPGEKGTLDAQIVFLYDKLIIVDYKYGAGVFVSAEKNLQLIAYALGAAKKYDYNFVDVELVIIQPRKADEDGNTVRKWACTMAELRAYESVFLKAVAEAEDELASTFRAGKWCQFCRGKPACKEISTVALEQAQVDFNDEEGVKSLPAPQHIGVKNLPVVLEAVDKLEVWIESVRSHALNLLKAGHAISGKKLVAKRGTRKYVDITKAEKEAAKLFGVAALSTPELLSPAQLEKAIKPKGVLPNEKLKKFLDKHATNVSTGVTIADADDKRPAVAPGVDDFADEDLGESKAVSKTKKGSKKK